MKKFDNKSSPMRAKHARRPFDTKRWGSIILLSTGIMIMVFGFLAFSVDVGYIALTKAQLETANDAGVRAAAIELRDGLGTARTKTPEEAKAAAAVAAVEVAAANRAGDRDSCYADPNRDLRFGQCIYDPVSQSWLKLWGVSPYNMVELTLHRDYVPPPTGDTSGVPHNNGDGPLPLFFAPVIGHSDASLATRATSALLPGNGFRIPTGSDQKLPVLPFALDLVTWEALIARDLSYGFPDNYSRSEDGHITATPDGVWEVNLYPEGESDLPPGNRGTVDIGLGNNSTSEIIRQILEGLNDADLACYSNNTVPEEISLSGDTGISAGFKEELNVIEGQSRLIPIFDTVSGSGDNAVYHIVKWVGVTVVKVKLVGNPKKVMVQPCTYVGPGVVPDYSGAPITEETYFTTPGLIQ